MASGSAARRSSEAAGPEERHSEAKQSIKFMDGADEAGMLKRMEITLPSNKLREEASHKY